MTYTRLPGGSRLPKPTRVPHRQVGDGQLTRREQERALEITLVLREKPGRPQLHESVDQESAKTVLDRKYQNNRQLAANHGWATTDLAKVALWAWRNGFEVAGTDPVTRALRLRSSTHLIDSQFSAGLRKFQTQDKWGRAVEYHAPTQALTLPPELVDQASGEPLVTALLGLNHSPAHSRLAVLAPNAQAKATYIPEQLAKLRNFPSLPNGGAGHTFYLGIGELGGAVNPKVAAWFLRQPAWKNVSLVELGINGAKPVSDPNGADVEVAADWQVQVRALLAANPNAHVQCLITYGANTDQGFRDAYAAFVSGAGVTSAKLYNGKNPGGITVKPKYFDPTKVATVSFSWGQNESAWLKASLQAIDSVGQAAYAKGVSFWNASGDNGAADLRNDGLLDIDMPAGCPNIGGVGGAKVVINNGVQSSISVWDEPATQRGASGGGVSRYFPPTPAEQNAGFAIAAVDDGHTGRTGPDVADSADPVYGWDVITDIDASGNPVHMNVGGTSLSAPFVAAGLACTSAVIGKKLGRVQDQFYGIAKAKGAGVSAITAGGNAYPPALQGYKAGPGSTGVGTLDFSALVTELQTITAPAAASPTTKREAKGPDAGLAA